MSTDVTPPPKPSTTILPTAGKIPPPSTTTTTTTTIPVTVSATPRAPEPDTDVIPIPSYSRWFSWSGVHECEVRFVPEFFDGRSPQKNPRVYKFHRNAIIRRFRENPTRKITFTEVRKTIIGDVGSVRRVFDFLEAWGLINYTGSNLKQPQLKWEDKDAKSAGATPQGTDAAAAGGSDVALAKKRICSSCKTPCTIACFSSEKHDMTLCARCYVRGNFRDGMSASEFRRVEITEETKTDWSDKEMLLLLEAVMHYGDDWKKVAEHVTGKTVKECVSRFLKLPFGEQFDGPPDSGEVDAELGIQNEGTNAKRMRLSPLADASNPIMAQAAFLSTLVGVDVAEVAARAAVTALSDLSDGKQEERWKAPSNLENPQESDISCNGNNVNTIEGAVVEAKLQLDKEEEEVEKAISEIAVQTQEIEDKIAHFEEFDLQLETKRKKLQHLQSLLFADRLSLLFHKTSAENTGGEEAIKID